MPRSFGKWKITYVTTKDILTCIVYYTYLLQYGVYICIVPDRRRRIVPEVVFVRRAVIGVPGIWRGRVWGKGWDRGGQFTSKLRPRWTDPVTARRVPSK